MTASGSIESTKSYATNRSELESILQNQGMIVINIKPIAQIPFFPAVGKKTSNANRIAFCKSFLALKKAGLSVLQILDTLILNQYHPIFNGALQVIHYRIHQGESLAYAISQCTDIFDHYLAASFRIGEETGDLESPLQAYIRFREQQAEIQKILSNALIYPAFLLGITFLVLALLSLLVLPNFAGVYADLGVELPWSTQILLGLSSHFGSILLGAMALAVLATAMILYAKSFPRFNQGLELLKLRLPIWGTLLRQMEALQLSQTFASGLANGQPMLACLDVAKDMTHQHWQRQNLLRLQNRLQEGSSLSAALEIDAILSPPHLQLIRIGEISGELALMFAEIARSIEEEIKNFTQRKLKFFEPFLLLMMGVLVGGSLISIYLPIFRLTEGLR